MKSTSSNYWRVLAACLMVLLAASANAQTQEPLACGANTRGGWFTGGAPWAETLFNGNLQSNLDLLNGLNLVSNNGFPPFASYDDVKDWTPTGGGKNQLSAQLAAMALNTNNSPFDQNGNGEIDGNDDIGVTRDTLVNIGDPAAAPYNCTSLAISGIVSLGALMDAANDVLGDPAATQGCISFLIDKLTAGNENLDDFFVDCDPPGVSDWPLEGRKFYDIDRDADRDDSEPLIPGWGVRIIGNAPIICTTDEEPCPEDKQVLSPNYPDKDGNTTLYSTTTTTDANGVFRFRHLTVGGVYGVCEAFPVPAANKVWAATTASYETGIFCPRHVGGDEAENDTLNANSCLTDDGTPPNVLDPYFQDPERPYVNIVPGRGPVDFGNVCTGGNGKTIGFWSNKNGKAVLGTRINSQYGMQVINDGTLWQDAKLTYSACHVGDFTIGTFQPWLTAANANNMASMLSAQLAAMKLNVWAGYHDAGSFINGTTIGDLIDQGEALLAEANCYPVLSDTVANNNLRSRMATVKTALDDGNNNRGVVLAFGVCARDFTDRDCDPADIQAIKDSLPAFPE